MDSENSEAEHVQWSVAVSTDRDQFFRRTCPSCGRDFKTRVDPVDLQWALNSYCRRTGTEIGPEGTDEPAPARIRCPYCAYEDIGSQMFTDETLAYLKRIALREWVVPQINRLFSGLESSFSGPRSSGGLFSISMEFSHSRSVVPVRPVHGPEPADLKIITFLCCGKQIKVSEAWTDVRACSFCGTTVVVI